MTDADLTHRITGTRRELEQTLDELGDKLNVKKQAGILVGRARAAYGENPVPFIAGATAVVVAIGGLIAWAALSGDD